MRGRQAEIDQLAQAVRATAAGSGTAILLEGAAGIGKTALLRTARDLAASSGFVVCAGDCDELDRVTPLAPLLTGLRSSAPPLVDAADQRALRSATEPMWAVERLGAILDKASARQPILVTVDDIQWADQTTVLALSVLPAWLFAVPVLWVLARRPNPASPQIQTLAERVSRAGGTVRSIGPVSPGGCAGHRLGHPRCDTGHAAFWAHRSSGWQPVLPCRAGQLAAPQPGRTRERRGRPADRP